jgi:hypothetical protein
MKNLGANPEPTRVWAWVELGWGGHALNGLLGGKSLPKDSTKDIIKTFFISKRHILLNAT